MHNHGVEGAMFEILAIFALLLSLAKHGKRRKFRRYLRGNADELLALGTLASRTLVSVAFDETVAERAFVTSLIATWSMENFTDNAGDGPILVGVAHSDYTSAEVEEWIENAISWREGNMIGQEVGRRKVKIVGTFFATGPSASVEALNSGRPMKTKLNWILSAGQTLQVWAYNLGTSALATTDPQIHVQGHVNIFPT